MPEDYVVPCCVLLQVEAGIQSAAGGEVEQSFLGFVGVWVDELALEEIEASRPRKPHHDLRRFPVGWGMRKAKADRLTVVS